MSEKDKKSFISELKKDEAKYKSFKITSVYFIIGCLWILFSDSIVSSIFKNTSEILAFSIIKGLLYVLATALIIFGLIYPALKEALIAKKTLENSNAELVKANNSLRALHQQMAKEKALLNSLLDSIPDLIYYKDSNCIYMGCNKAFGEFAGKTEKEIIGNSDYELFNREEAELFRKMDTEMMRVRTRISNEEVVTYPDGKLAYLETLKTPFYDSDNNIIGIIGISRDITERKKREETINFLSQHDALTGLHNRTYFEEQVSRLDTPECHPISVIMGDVNGMKLINESFGSAAGDMILKEVAETISACSREDYIVTRVGGDEFSVIMPRTNNNTAVMVADKIRSACRRVQKEKNLVNYSMALGVATKTGPEESFHRIIALAHDYMIRRKLLEQTSLHSSILASIKSTMFEKSNETEEHAERLSKLSKELGLYVSLAENKLDELVLVAELHDIGKISVDQRILTKVEKLSEEDWREIKKHPGAGYRIANSTPELRHISDYILCHHERWDGKGYPQGLAGEEIPLISRIIAIVDAYDAMTEDRAYRKAFSKEYAASEILKNAGTQFDPELAKLFVEKVLKVESC